MCGYAADLKPTTTESRPFETIGRNNNYLPAFTDTSQKGRRVMALFYFHLLDGDKIDEDTEGIELPDLETAKSECRQTAREMMIENIALGLPVHNQVFEVCDEFGSLLFKLAFSDVLDS